jgi:predicted ATP-grasp superfamily ATP-dependent carboligase
MNILVTSSRMPFALDEIRKFGRAGHRVFAADTFYSAPGSHSRYVTEHFEVDPPEQSARRYVAAIDRLLRRCQIDLLVPCFEEVFYLARHRDRLRRATQLFAADFTLLARLHNKAAFRTLAEELSIPTPATLLVRSPPELEDALQRIGRYVARPAWSRGGVQLCTNAGPLAGALSPSVCRPTRAQPWIVQEYLPGADLCSFTVARHGRIQAHCTYVHPREIEHAGGIVFESIVDTEVEAAVRRIVGATRYHGQISMDFRRGPRGLVLLECNPRPTAGVHLMQAATLVDAVLGRNGDMTARVPPGIRRSYASALVRDALLHPRELARDLTYLLSDARDVYAEPGDRVPLLFQILSYGCVLTHRLRSYGPIRPKAKLMDAYFDGIRWNGQPI